MSTLVASKAYKYTVLVITFFVFFGEMLNKLERAWDHTVNMKFNVFYSTFTSVFYSCHILKRFFTLISTFLHLPSGPKKRYTWFNFAITSVNVHRF